VSRRRGIQGSDGLITPGLQVPQIRIGLCHVVRIQLEELPRCCRNFPLQPISFLTQVLLVVVAAGFQLLSGYLVVQRLQMRWCQPRLLQLANQ
jgi:hypothetical protein